MQTQQKHGANKFPHSAVFHSRRLSLCCWDIPERHRGPHARIERGRTSAPRPSAETTRGGCRRGPGARAPRPRGPAPPGGRAPRRRRNLRWTRSAGFGETCAGTRSKRPFRIVRGGRKKNGGLNFNNVEYKADFHTKISKQKQEGIDAIIGKFSCTLNTLLHMFI